MTSFWIFAAAMALAAPLFVAVPLLRGHRPRALAAPAGEASLAVHREQFAELLEERRSGRLGETEYAQARAELERRLLEEVPEGAAPAASPGGPHRAAAMVAMIVLPLAGAFLYVTLGNPAALRPPAREVAHGFSQQQLDAMVARLAARLQQNPQDADGWMMLARAHSVLGRFEAASAAYARAADLRPDDAQLLADYADALAVAQGGLAGQPERLIERALQLDPANAKALALAGTVAFRRQDYPLAVAFWKRLRATAPANSGFAASVQRNIDEASALASASTAQPVTAAGRR